MTLPCFLITLVCGFFCLFVFTTTTSMTTDCMWLKTVTKTPRLQCLFLLHRLKVIKIFISSVFLNRFWIPNLFSVMILYLWGDGKSFLFSFTCINYSLIILWFLFCLVRNTVQSPNCCFYHFRASFLKGCECEVVWLWREI